MEVNKILSMVDHTILKNTATWEDIKQACDDGIRYGVACVCVPNCYVANAKKYVGDRVNIGSVTGFPYGYNTTEAKIFEAKKAIEDGADEIDMVLNIGWLKSGNFQAVEDEIKAIKEAVGNKTLKVIIETGVLTEEEKIAACKIVTNAGADFIKTSTGFTVGGATREDVKLFAENVGKGVRIKAAGGIKTLEAAEDFINLGATRLGTSTLIKNIKGQKIEGSETY
ncbi:MAG TPA: deoxyribose-phosphate aldolase [Clostridiaceae bacterium]|nr:deoxyribose-phosphate aldolase [Clostridiaceae bacterium]